MKLIVGLGNPGKKYENTRHNVGFMAIDYLVEQLKKEHTITELSKFNSLIYEVRYNQEKLILVKPLTYMNLSGEAVKPIVGWYKIDPKDMVVIYDDLDLPFGRVRFRSKGSSGGHNGMKSIIYQLNTDLFKRVRLGIGNPENIPVVDYVLTNFSNEEKKDLNQNINLVAKALKDWINGTDFAKVMSTYQQ